MENSTLSPTRRREQQSGAGGATGTPPPRPPHSKSPPAARRPPRAFPLSPPAAIPHSPLPPLTRSAAPRQPHAFSLVELTITIGIVAFVMMALIGVMPIGMAASQEAMRQTAHSHILRQISSDLAMLPFEEVGNYVSAAHHFDYEGQRTSAQNGSVFTVNMQPLAPNYPGSGGLNRIGDRMQRVVVEIRRSGADPDAPAARAPLTVVNAGR